VLLTASATAKTEYSPFSTRKTPGACGKSL
jgi:hypothetical protein